MPGILLKYIFIYFAVNCLNIFTVNKYTNKLYIIYFYLFFASSLTNSFCTPFIYFIYNCSKCMQQLKQLTRCSPLPHQKEKLYCFL